MPEGFVLGAGVVPRETLVGEAYDWNWVRYLHSVRHHPVIRLGYEPDMSNTAQRIPPSQSAGCDRNQAAALSAVLPGTMSISWWPPTSTTEVHHCLVRQRPRRQNNVSSTPTASTVPTRSVSASNRASPQRPTSLFTVCQSQPNSAATWIVRPRPPTWMVTHRAARDVNNARWGPIVGSCSMNDLKRTVGVRTCPAPFPPPQPHRPTERR